MNPSMGMWPCLKTIAGPANGDPGWTNEGKDKGELGAFLQQLFIYSKRGKACGTTKVYWVCNAGKEERGVGGATIIQATYQSRHSADLM